MPDGVGVSVCKHECVLAGSDTCSHMHVSERFVGGRETCVCTHTHTCRHIPVLTGGCGKEGVPELGSACLWLRERGI